jgi:hypothetical protein
VLADATRLLGAEHRTTLTASVYLAAAYSQAGRADAVEFLERVLVDSERILGTDHPATLKAGESLAGARRETRTT